MKFESVLHYRADARTLGLFRAFLFGIWIPFLITDPIENLAYLGPQFFYPQGLLELIPNSAWDLLLSASFLATFKWILAALLLITASGWGRFRAFAIPTTLLLIVYQGLYRCFGGHLNHQELGLLFGNLLLCFFPCNDGFALAKTPHSKVTDNAQYFWGTFSVALMFTFTYAVIGIARLIEYRQSPYINETMLSWVVEHGKKDNFWSFDISELILGNIWVDYFFRASFAFATVLEIASPLAVFSKRFRLVWIPMIAGFHIMIFLTMNIFFIQNILMLLLFVEVAAFYRSKGQA